MPDWFAVDHLDETIGLQGGASNTDISFWFHGPGYTPIPTNGSPLDWNKDGNFTDTGVVNEINDGDGPEQEHSQNDGQLLRSMVLTTSRISISIISAAQTSRTT
jgi:hypothetical protein